MTTIKELGKCNFIEFKFFDYILEDGTNIDLEDEETIEWIKEENLEIFKEWIGNVWGDFVKTNLNDEVIEIWSDCIFMPEELELKK